MHRILGLMIALIVVAGSPAFAAQYSLSTAANSGGTVSPQKGKIAVSEGDASDVTFTALPGYYISKVKVDSIYVPVTDRKSFTYRFPDIRKNHKIAAKFLRDPAVHVDYTKGGTIDSGKGKIFVPYSTGRTFAITPSEGYHIASVTADGKAAGAVESYSFGSVVSRRSLKAKFSLNTYEVELQPGTGGTITPAITTATHGQLKTFTILPDSGMKIDSVTVNGAPVANLPEAGPHKVKHAVTGKVSVAATFTERPVEAAFKKAPYLLYTGSNTSMTVLWQATAGLTSTIKWGTDTSYSLGTATVNQSTTDHLFAFPIPDLAPATKYYYKVELSQAEATGSFYTAPAADATKAKLFVFGDTRTNPSRHDKVAARMNAECLTDPDFQSIALLTGDLVGDGNSESEWTNQFFPLKYENIKKFASEIPRQSARGNHEGGAGLFRKYFPAPYVGGRYWSFDYGPAHVTIVDQYEGGGNISAKQLEWITADLAASTKKWKIIMLHEPGWSAGGHGNNGAVQKKIQPLAKQYNAVVFSGHNHYYSRAVVDGIHHITAGGGGAPLDNPSSGKPNIVATDSSNHFCAVDIDGDTMKVRAIRADGTMIEDFTITQP